MKFLIYFASILVFITISSQYPQIFQEKGTCEISVQRGKKTKSYFVPDQINAENDELRVSVSLCTKDNYVPSGQATYPEITVYDKSSSIARKNNDHTPYEVSEDREAIIISSSSDIKCTDNLNYTVTIKLENSYFKKPRLTVEIECELEIGITHPDYEPTCKKLVDSKWYLDLSPLRGRPLTVRNDKGETIYVSLCGPLRACSQQAGCKIGTNETIIFGSVTEQKVKFDYGSNAVSVSSFIKDGTSKRSKKTMLVNLKCNWNVPYVSNAKLLNEGRNFKFEVESSFGCVKLPKSCIITDNSNHLIFDLRSLSNKNGIVVINTTSTIRLNICGDLLIKGVANNKCHTEKSQVCEIRGNSYSNKGSIPYFEVHDGNIRASFRNGGYCNVNETYSTIVNFICSAQETGPVFVSQENCLTNISWETAKACPSFQIASKTCSFHSSYGDIDLTELYVADGVIELLSSNRKLVYNICGKLNSNCSNSDGVAVCLIDRNRQEIIGWDKPDLSYTNGDLQLKYTGEKCQGKKIPYSFTVNMVCSYEGKQLTKPIVTEVDSCTFTTTFSTSSACLKPWNVKNCTIEGDNYKYDLTALRRFDRNYEIIDGRNRERKFYLNMCTPIIPGKNLFHPNSMLSMEDSSEALITKRFPHLGKVTEPIVQGDDLIVILPGQMCEPGVSYTSKISLECSNKEEYPTIISNDSCSFEFIWRTKHACPIMKKGGRCSITDGTETIEVPGDPIEIKTNNYYTYSFSLCLNYYRWCSNNQICVTKKLSKRISRRDDIFYVQLNLNDSDGSPLKTANMIVECDRNTYISSSEGQGRNPTHLDIYVKTRISCAKESRMINRAADKVETGKEHEYIVVTETEKLQKIEQTSETPKKEIKKTEELHRTEATVIEQESKEIQTPEEEQTPKEEQSVEIHNPSEKAPNDQKTESKETVYHESCKAVTIDRKTLQLKDLTYIEFKSSNTTFIINFDGKSNKCGGLLCREGGNILNFIENCPDVSIENDRINLDYANTESREIINAANSSNNYVGKKIRISLQCTREEITAKASETNTKITVYYASHKICIFSESPTNYLMIVFVIIGLLLMSLLCFTLFVLYRKDFFKKCSYEAVSEERGLINHSKML